MKDMTPDERVAKVDTLAELEGMKHYLQQNGQWEGAIVGAVARRKAELQLQARKK